MNEAFVSYLESIGMTKTLIARVGMIHGLAQHLCPEEIADLFVSEYITENGTREYLSVFFFSTTYSMEAKQFVNMEHLDIVPTKIGYIDIKLTSFDLEKAGELSRMLLDAYLVGSLSAATVMNLRASGDNCNHLVKIMGEYIKPKLET